jgi:hypothetical protein
MVAVVGAVTFNIVVDFVGVGAVGGLSASFVRLRWVWGNGGFKR